MSFINFLKNSAPSNKSKKFGDIFAFIHFYIILLIYTEAVGSLGIFDGFMALGMVLFVVLFEPTWLIMFLVYLLVSMIIAWYLTSISQEKFNKIHCLIWLVFMGTVGLWIVGKILGVFPYNTNPRTYF